MEEEVVVEAAVWPVTCTVHSYQQRVSPLGPRKPTSKSAAPWSASACLVRVRVRVRVRVKVRVLT